MSDIISEDSLGAVDIAAEGVGVEIFDIIIVGDFFEFALAAFDRVVDVAKNESNSDGDGRSANHRHEANFAPSESGTTGRFAGSLGAMGFTRFGMDVLMEKVGLWTRGLGSTGGVSGGFLADGGGGLGEFFAGRGGGSADFFGNFAAKSICTFLLSKKLRRSVIFAEIGRLR